MDNNYFENQGNYQGPDKIKKTPLFKTGGKLEVSV